MTNNSARYNNITPPESQVFSISYRAACQNDGTVLAYSQRLEQHTAHQVRFDSEAILPASTDHVALACLSDMLEAFQLAALQLNLVIEEIEGTAELRITEPLFLAGVKGYTQPSHIAGIILRLYVCVDCDGIEFDALCNNALRCSSIYQSLRNAFSFEVHFSQEL